MILNIRVIPKANRNLIHSAAFKLRPLRRGKKTPLSVSTLSKPRALARGASNGLICVVSRRQDGNMSLVYGETGDALNSRKIFLENLGIDYRDLACAKQIHGRNVRYVRSQDKGRGALSYETAIEDTDALVTDEPDLPLSVFTADCLSVFLYDPQRPAIGLAHAGWRSSQENIAANTIKAMQERFNANASTLRVGFGPAIRSCCYEVKEEFNAFFPGQIIKRHNRYYLDLAGVNKKQLLDAGAKEGNIFDCGICTSCRNDDFFSYRKEGKNCGRMISVMMLRGGRHG